MPRFGSFNIAKPPFVAQVFQNPVRNINRAQGNQELVLLLHSLFPLAWRLRAAVFSKLFV
jgi:hypothetical protein